MKIFLAHVLCGAKLASFSPKADGVLINYRGVMYPHSSAPPQGHEHARHRHYFRTNPVIFALLSSCYPESRGWGPTLTGSLMTKLLQQNMIFLSWPKGSVVVFLTELFIFVSIG